MLHSGYATRKLRARTHSAGAALLIAALLGLTPSAGWAAWEKVGESENGDVFIDKSTIKLNGTNIRVMTLISPKEAPPPGRKSVPVSFLRQAEIICKTAQMKTINGLAYTGIMATGAVFSREDVGRFAKVIPGTPLGRQADAACEANGTPLPGVGSAPAAH